MKSSRGMGLLIAVILLTVVSIGIGLVVPIVYQVIAADNSSRTVNDLQALKIALAGNPRLVVIGGRSDFGFIGTMGNVPAQLSSLWLKGSQPAYTFNTTRKVGGGWVGPYIPSSFVEDLRAMDKDRYGNPLIYTSTPFTRPSDNQVVAARIQSAGSDGVANTADDHLVDILQDEVYSTITGTLLKGDKPVAFATVTLNIPANGVIGQQFNVTNVNGGFQFNNVTFGLRSVSIDPKLTFEPNSASVQGVSTLRFTVTNYATNDITITSITPTYNIVAFYENIRVGNTTVFNYTSAPHNGTRAASGQTITFSTPVTVGGSGKPTQVVPIRVDKKATVTPNLLIKGTGKSVVIQLQGFTSTQTGLGLAVNPSGATFTINFSDGSSNTFTVP